MRPILALVVLALTLGLASAQTPVVVPEPVCAVDPATGLTTCRTTVNIAGAPAGKYLVSGQAATRSGHVAEFGPVSVPVCERPKIERTDTTIEIEWTCPDVSKASFSVTRE